MSNQIIFDTDLGSDCDDMMALAYLGYAEKYLNVPTIAITHSLKCDYGVPAINSFRKFHGLEKRPVGYMEGGADLTDQYAEALAKKFAVKEDYISDGTAVQVLRKSLVNSNGNVVICAVGQFTNIGALLDSKGDDISSLNGVELVKKYCSKIVVMAGMFYDNPDGTRPKEWNVKWDVPAFKTVIEKSPVTVAFLPSEMGIKVITGKNLETKYGDSNPLAHAFKTYPSSKNGRASWDPITTVYAVEGAKNYFNEIIGTVTVDDEGATYFTEDKNGNHVLLHYNYSTFKTTYKAHEELAKYIDCCAEKFIDGD